jgi:hypothetical protein
MHNGRTPARIVQDYQEAARRIHQLPGVENVAVGSVVPWRDAEGGGEFGLETSPDGHVPTPAEEDPRARVRVVTPGFFATLGRPILEGRDFTDADRSDSEPVVVISESLAKKEFPGRDPLGHHLMWTDPILQVVPQIVPKPMRVIGVVADIDDIDLVPKAAAALYRPFAQEQLMGGGRLFVYVRSNPHALVEPITRIIHNMAADQPVERAQTLAEVRAQVLSSDRLNMIVSSVFAGVALLIAVVGVAGVLAFSVSGRRREFGIRLAIGSQPRQLLARVIAEGATMAIAGLVIGAAAGFWLAQLVGAFLGGLKTPGLLPVAGAGLVLLLAAVIASLIPAARAAHVDVIEALRTE